MTMTIKSFKEHAEINENPIGGLAALGYGAYKTYKVAKKAIPVVKNYMAKKSNTYSYAVPVGAVPTVNRASEIIGRAADKVGAIPDNIHKQLKNPFKNRKPKPNTAYSPVKPSAKGQAEGVKLDEKMPPEAHVARSKKNPDMFCVFDKDGKEVKLFKDKKDAEAYAVKNHDQLMGEAGLWANIHKKRERIKRGSGETMRKKGDKGAPKSLDVGEGFASDAQRRAAFASGYKAKGKKEPGDKGYPKTLDIEAKEDFDGVKNAVKRAYTNISNRGIHYSKGRIKTYNRNPKPAGTPSTASKYSPAKGTSRAENIEGFASDAQRRAVFASGYKAKGKKEGAMSRIDYQTKSGEKSTGLSTFKKKPVSSDYKPYPKPGKKPLYGDKVDEISRYDLGKKIISTMGTKAPTMLTKHDDEKKKVKTDLERLRKALGPDHSMNKARA